MPLIKSVIKHPISQARKLFTRLDTLIRRGEAICITRLKALTDRERRERRIHGAYSEPVFVILHWEDFQDMQEILKTIEDPLVMLDFLKHKKENQNKSTFADVFKGMYSKLGYYDREDDFDKKE